MKYITKVCMHCGTSSEVDMTLEQHHRLTKTLDHVQDIFPEKSAGERELLITGTHSKCWDEMFPEEDEPQPEDSPHYGC